MINLEAVDSFTISGRGTAYVFAGREDIPNPELLRNTVVLISGAEYMVTGVERRGYSYLGPNGSFSLLVTPIPAIPAT